MWPGWVRGRENKLDCMHTTHRMSGTEFRYQDWNVSGIYTFKSSSSLIAAAFFLVFTFSQTVTTLSSSFFVNLSVLDCIDFKRFLRTVLPCTYIPVWLTERTSANIFCENLFIFFQKILIDSFDYSFFRLYTVFWSTANDTCLLLIILSTSYRTCQPPSLLGDMLLVNKLEQGEASMY